MSNSIEFVDLIDLHEETNCMICLELVNIYIVTNKCKCKLYVHENCFQSWIDLHNSCFICKSVLTVHCKQLQTKDKYFYEEFEKSKLIFYLEFMMSRVCIMSDKINNDIIKYILCNVLFGSFAFFNLIIVIIYITILSQSKYAIDKYKGVHVHNSLYTIFNVKKNHG